MPKISIIIPVYNVGQYIPRCLDSLINQTLSDIEIICINDCSLDNSLEVLKEYASKDERIKIIDLKENQGAAIARNKGLEVAKGEYLGFVDSDDYVDLDFYEKLYKKAIADNADIVKGNHKTYELDGQSALSNLNSKIKKIGNKFLFSYAWWSAIYKKSLIEENKIIFPEECRKGQDIVFLFKCVLNANKISLLDDVFYNYIRRDDSLDFGKLSFEKVLSNLKANSIIIEELNTSNLSSTNPELYTIAYYMHLKGVLYPCFKSDSYEAKYECMKKMVEFYHACKLPCKLEKVYEFTALLPYIKSNDLESLTNEMLNCKTQDRLMARCRMAELRSNVKRDLIKNA